MLKTGDIVKLKLTSWLIRRLEREDQLQDWKIICINTCYSSMLYTIKGIKTNKLLNVQEHELELLNVKNR